MEPESTPSNDALAARARGRLVHSGEPQCVFVTAEGGLYTVPERAVLAGTYDGNVVLNELTDDLAEARNG